MGEGWEVWGGVKMKDGELFLSLCSFSSSQSRTSGRADLTGFLPPPQLFFLQVDDATPILLHPAFHSL